MQKQLPKNAVALQPVARTKAIAGGRRLALAVWVGSAPVNISLIEYYITTRS
jgi:hypothetical protein